ncbi:hybrid sensor histidine kinase/response regulator [Magnetococcales bacterium HHB-1]
MDQNTITLLLVEGDLVDQMSFKRMVVQDKLPYRFTETNSLSEAIAALSQQSFQVIIATFDLCDGNVTELIPHCQNIPLIVVTGKGDEEAAAAAMRAGAAEYLIKDHQRNYLKMLPDMINKAIRRFQEKNALKRAQEYAKNLINSSLDMIVGLNEEGIIVEFNQAAQKQFHLPRKDALGKPWKLLFHHPDQAQTILNALDSENSFSDEISAQRQNGSLFDAFLSASLMRDDHNNIVGYMGIFRDITERKRMERDLKLAKEEAEEANRAKTSFLANMSHETRTPLNAVIGMTELAISATDDQEKQEYLDIVSESAKSLLTMLNTLLDLGQMEQDQLKLNIKAFHPKKQLEKDCQAFIIQAKNKGLTLSLRTAPNLPDILRGDPERISQILIQLIRNAIKFTAEGSIDVEVGVLRQIKEKVDLSISVSDTGIGVPEKRQQAIFQLFNQADPSFTRQYGGVGLGLAMAHRLVKLMDGEIGVENRLAGGSRFHFTIPMTLGSDNSAHDKPKNSYQVNPLMTDIRKELEENNLPQLEILGKQLRETIDDPPQCKRFAFQLVLAARSNNIDKANQAFSELEQALISHQKGTA